MKKSSITKLLIATFMFVVVLAVGYNISEFTKNSDNQSTTASTTNNKTTNTKSNNKTSSNEAKLAKTPKEENKKINRSDTIDVNKVDDIISRKLPNGVITNLVFKNDSDNPHYEVSVISKNIKYKFEISTKDGSIKEVKKEDIKAS